MDILKKNVDQSNIPAGNVDLLTGLAISGRAGLCQPSHSAVGLLPTGDTAKIEVLYYQGIFHNGMRHAELDIDPADTSA